jgi:hypothetical protein
LILNHFSVNERNKLIKDAAAREQIDKEFSQKEYENLLKQREYQNQFPRRQIEAR